MPEPEPQMPVPGTSQLKVSKAKIQVMVDNALKSLDDRTGSSVIAIKKFIALTYDIDIEKSSKSIKKYIKESLENGKLIQTKGKGSLVGSFKLSAAAKEELKHKSKENKTKPREEQTSKKTAGKAQAKKKKVDSGDLGTSEKPSKPKVSTKKDALTKKAVLPKLDATEKSKKIVKAKKLTTKTTDNISPKTTVSTKKKKENLTNGKKKDAPPKKTDEMKGSNDRDGAGNEPEVSLKNEIKSDPSPNVLEYSASSEGEETDAAESQSDFADLLKKTQNKKKGKSAKTSVKKRKSIATLVPTIKPARFKLG